MKHQVQNASVQPAHQPVPKPVREYDKQQQAEKAWHEALFGSREKPDFVIPEVIRRRYLRPPVRPVFEKELMFRLVGDVRGKRVMVFGAGDDNSTTLLAMMGADVWAIDLSEEAIQIQKGMAEANGVSARVRTVVCAGEELPFKDGTFDLIFISAVLHHIPDRLAELPGRLSGLLRQGGRAVCCEPTVRSHALRRLVQKLPGKQEISPRERPLDQDDLAGFFDRFDVRSHYFCFLSRLDRFVLKGPLEVAPRAVRMLVHAFHRLDRALLSVPLFDRLAGVVVMELHPRN